MTWEFEGTKEGENKYKVKIFSYLNFFERVLRLEFGNLTHFQFNLIAEPLRDLVAEYNKLLDRVNKDGESVSVTVQIQKDQLGRLLTATGPKTTKRRTK